MKTKANNIKTGDLLTHKKSGDIFLVVDINEETVTVQYQNAIWGAVKLGYTALQIARRFTTTTRVA